MHTINIKYTNPSRWRRFWAYFFPSLIYRTSLLPASWDEISESEFLQLVPLLLQSDGRAKALSILCRLPHRWFRRMTDDQLYDILLLTNWLFEKHPEIMIKNPLIISGTEYHLPGDRMESAAYGEYVEAEGIVRRFLQNGEEEDLNHLCAILARPMAPFGPGLVDREKFHSPTAKARIGTWSKSPLNERLSILLYFLGCQQFIHKKFGILFEGSGKGDGFGWVGLMFDLSKTDAFGDSNQVFESNLMPILVFLSREKLNYEASKQNGN